MENILHNFDDFFKIISADTPKLVQDVQHLRYDIFCGEKGYFDVNNPDHLEKDDFDSRSVHCLLAHRETGEYAATVRLVLPSYINSSFKFPVEEHISPSNTDTMNHFLGVPRLQLAEISRFSVSKSFRRRVGEIQAIHGINNRFGLQMNFKGRRFDSFITLGLFKAIVKMSAENDILYWCAFLEPSLLRLLGRVGIEFKQLGEKINHYGERYVCFAKAQNVLEGIREVKPEIWSFITDNGRYLLATNVKNNQTAVNTFA